MSSTLRALLPSTQLPKSPSQHYMALSAIIFIGHVLNGMHARHVNLKKYGNMIGHSRFLRMKRH